jgi:large subunit ribosomal protein L17
MKTTSRKFSRKSPEKALMQGLAQSIILKERIKTTQIRGQEAARFTEKIITKGKQGDLSAHREIRRHLSDKAAKKVINDLALRYKDRAGGYTRVIKLGQRSSDGARMVFIELV